MLFLIFQIQNSYNQKPCIQDNHKFFICTHKPHSFLQDSETEWYRILPVAWVSILYCQNISGRSANYSRFIFYSQYCKAQILFSFTFYKFCELTDFIQFIFCIFLAIEVSSESSRLSMRIICQIVNGTAKICRKFF